MPLGTVNISWNLHSLGDIHAWSSRRRGQQMRTGLWIVASIQCVVLQPLRMHRTNVIAARPLQQLELMNPEGRPSEDGSTNSSDSAVSEGFVYK